MDIRLLQYFLTIAEEENITRAAAKLNMSQPPLSRQLRQLEEQLGVTLFERGKRKMQLTEAGYFLKNRGVEILDLIKKTEDQLHERCDGTSGLINIGSIETAGASVLPQLIASYKKAFPKVSFDIWNGNSDDIVERLDKGFLDIGIVREPFNSQRYEGIMLPKEPWMVLMHVDNPLAADASEVIELSALAKAPLIIPSRIVHGIEINQWFGSIGIKPNIFCVYNALMSAIVLVRENTGVALCPLSAKNILASENLVYKEIIHPRVESSPVIIWKKYKYVSGAVNNFLDLVKKRYKQKKRESDKDDFAADEIRD